jgi:diguanylate cyclase (GGDEF)-like protein
MRRSLTTTFAVVSLAAFLALGVVLSLGMNKLLHEQGLSDAKSTAHVVTNLGVEHNFPSAGPGLFRQPLSAKQARLVDVSIAGSRPAVRHLRLWSPTGELVYSSVGIADQAKAPAASAFRAALDDRVGVNIDTTTSRGGNMDVVNVYVPVHLRDLVMGVAQVTMPYADTEARVAAASKKIAGLIFAGLLLVWLILFRVVHRASTRLRSQAEENERLALHDPLTGLPNRRLLSERLERAALLSHRTGARVGLLMLDLDRFKEVNDTLGHDRGDQLLKQVAERLVLAVRAMDTVARLGGDEFAILLPSFARIEDAEELGRRVVAVFDQSFELEGLDLHVDASLGLAVLPDHADDVTSMMQRADVAMYVAKASHIGLSTYSSESDAHNTERLVLLGDLRHALDVEGELEVFYQPKVNLASGEVVGLEALLRWNHPVHGLVMPDDFVPLAERTGLIHPLTRHVLDIVVRQVAEWDRAGKEVPVAVNLSGRNLNEPRFVDFIADLLDRHCVHPCLLELEITESAMIDDPAGAQQMLNRLAALGLQISVDDFGTGYTSMAQLERLPLRALKIDRSFVWRMLDDPGGAVLVKAIIDLAHEFNLVVVAEGVEQEPMLAELRRLGCDIAQGFHWSEAVPGAEVHGVLDRICVARGRESQNQLATPSA